MGGSRREDTNRASNGLYLCADCHAWVESHRDRARLDGLLLTQGEYPPVRFVERRGEVVCLDDDGGYAVMKAAAGGVAI
jgi:5-methylcytosine-specific restriction protein A